MPVGRDSSFYGDSNNGTTGTGLSQNPVFKVNVRSLDNPNEQPQNQQKNNSQEEIKYNIGDIVSGQSLSDPGKTYSGKITNIKKNEQNTISYIEIINSKTGKKEKLDPQTCAKTDPNKQVAKNDLETQAKFPYSESRKFVLSYSEFLNL